MALAVTSLKKIEGSHAFQTGDRRGWVEFVGAIGRTALLRVAQMTAGVARDGLQAFIPGAIPLIILQTPGAVERGRSEVVPIPGDQIAGSVTDATVDALDGRVGGPACARPRRNVRHLFVT